MTNREAERFEEFFAESFNEGVIIRELRLSNAEVEYITTKYPKVQLKQCFTQETSDGKRWFEVRLQRPKTV